ncbi:integral membrane protein [Histoplasma capsulatum G186AR]|uniref:Integral membrane protein n=2 Tax=Ajellomyces capsulatus TaxID=5037 RepID=C0NNG2_AJECG|nr:uncharacterized protein HCBG_04289 [Histoplasma capsulatum G186AR]EEH07410.1 integral membrane protein [Histoplasma capsulatum G186AR]KAG5304454.1 integral membrane protein [Histoplasma capsulatum]QSS70052.1 integral membrane protein [Histoplasma capsulatum G186AR]
MSGMELQRRNAPGPQVIHPIPDANRRGMIALFTLSLFSVITTGALVAWLTYRLIFWRRYYTRYPGRNQFIVLIYNLLIADLHQALANMVSPYWLIKDMVSTYSPACFAQGWLINVGNIASGMFVLAIAVHTFVNVVTRKTLGHGVFVGSVIGVWIFSIVVTLIGPALRGIHIYAPTGAWCWIDNQYGEERLYLHYFWIFVAEIGIIIIYPTLFFIVRRRLKSSKDLRVNGTKRPKFNRVLKVMFLYPIAYIVISLPIAAGRMSLMNGRSPGMTYFYATGTLLMCSGWVDSILYFITRRHLLEGDIQTESASNGSQIHDRSYDIPPTIGGGTARSIGRQKPGTTVLKHTQTLQTISSSTDNIIDAVELPELGGLDQMTAVKNSSESTRVPSSSSSSHRQPANSYPNVPSTSTNGPLAQPDTTRNEPTQFQMHWAR